jgi:hypothetical protein
LVAREEAKTTDSTSSSSSAESAFVRPRGLSVRAHVCVAKKRHHSGVTEEEVAPPGDHAEQKHEKMGNLAKMEHKSCNVVEEKSAVEPASKMLKVEKDEASQRLDRDNQGDGASSPCASRLVETRHSSDESESQPSAAVLREAKTRRRAGRHWWGSSHDPQHLLERNDDGVAGIQSATLESNKRRRVQRSLYDASVVQSGKKKKKNKCLAQVGIQLARF